MTPARVHTRVRHPRTSATSARSWLNITGEQGREQNDGDGADSAPAEDGRPCAGRQLAGLPERLNDESEERLHDPATRSMDTCVDQFSRGSIREGRQPEPRLSPARCQIQTCAPPPRNEYRRD